MMDDDFPPHNNSLIRDLDALIQQRGQNTEVTELYSLVLGIGVYRLQHLIGKQAVIELLESVIQGLGAAPPMNLRKLN